MPLRNYKTNKLLFVFALLAVFLFHGGIIYAITHVGGNKNQAMSAEPVTMFMHHMSLAGVDTAQEITNQHDDEDKPSEENDATEDEPQKEIEEVVEEKLESESVSKEPEKEVITTQTPMPEAPKIQAKPEVKKPKPKPKSQPKAQNKQQSRRVENRVYAPSDLQVIAKPAPVYPRPLQMRRVTGVAILILSINEQGRVESVRLQKSTGHEKLDQEAQKAAYKFRIKPFVVNGQPQKIQVRIPYEFASKR